MAPHPDDEAIGAWALMRRLRRAGARVDVLVVSDGGASHPGSIRWPHARLTRERRRETLRAMASLSLPPSRVTFLALPDGSLEAEGQHIRRIVGRAFRRRRTPDLIVGPVPHDAHGDHRAVAMALAALPLRGERRLGYQVWPKDAQRSAKGLTVRLDGTGMAAKRRVVRSYRTQTGTITDAAAGFTMTSHHLRAFVRPVERFEELA